MSSSSSSSDSTTKHDSFIDDDWLPFDFNLSGSPIGNMSPTHERGFHALHDEMLSDSIDKERVEIFSDMLLPNPNVDSTFDINSPLPPLGNDSDTGSTLMNSNDIDDSILNIPSRQFEPDPSSLSFHPLSTIPKISPLSLVQLHGHTFCTKLCLFPQKRALVAVDDEFMQVLWKGGIQYKYSRLDSFSHSNDTQPTYRIGTFDDISTPMQLSVLNNNVSTSSIPLFVTELEKIVYWEIQSIMKILLATSIASFLETENLFPFPPPSGEEDMSNFIFTNMDTPSFMSSNPQAVDVPTPSSIFYTSSLLHPSLLRIIKSNQPTLYQQIHKYRDMNDIDSSMVSSQWDFQHQVFIDAACYNDACFILTKDDEYIYQYICLFGKNQYPEQIGKHLLQNPSTQISIRPIYIRAYDKERVFCYCLNNEDKICMTTNKLKFTSTQSSLQRAWQTQIQIKSFIIQSSFLSSSSSSTWEWTAEDSKNLFISLRQSSSPLITIFSSQLVKWIESISTYTSHTFKILETHQSTNTSFHIRPFPFTYVMFNTVWMWCVWIYCQLPTEDQSISLTKKLQIYIFNGLTIQTTCQLNFSAWWTEWTTFVQSYLQQSKHTIDQWNVYLIKETKLFKHKFTDKIENPLYGTNYPLQVFPPLTSIDLPSQSSQLPIVLNDLEWQ